MNIPKIPQQTINTKKYLNSYQNYQTFNTKYNQDNISFGCKKPTSKFFTPLKNKLKPITDLYDTGIEHIAKIIGKALDTKFTYNLLQSTKRNKNLFNHLMTLGSVILSGLYITRTLTNKDLDEKKRKTLAINQGLVFAFSTAMCYLAEGKLKSKVTAFANKFEAVNHGYMPEDKLIKCTKGIGIAGKIMVFDVIYRFIAPVFITPVANHFGNKLNEGN